ncbi:MAG: hypothetical protein RJA70_2705 [Pseudomonadota bacterium]|jgi:RNA polymerase sigma-70 factor (ECF subfamily)
MESDEELFASWGADQNADGQTLIERHYDSIAAFFRTKVDPASADDLVQRTFLVCAEKRHTTLTNSFRAFVFGIARLLLLEHFRARSRHGVLPDFHRSSIVDLNPSPSTLHFKKDEQRVLVEALQRLPVELQVAIELYYWEELSVAELALVSEVPPGTVKSRLHRARELLLALVEDSPTPRATKRAALERLAHLQPPISGDTSEDSPDHDLPPG